jgi:hypothetical protein
MAELQQVGPNRAFGIVEVEVQLTEPIDTLLPWPIVAPGTVDELPDLRITINPMNVWAFDGYTIDNFTQDAHGRVSFDLTNLTAGAPGSMGVFRIEVDRVKS